MANILITGSGCPGWYSVYRSMYDQTVYSCDLHTNTYGSIFSKKHFIVPNGNDISYKNTIIDIIFNNNIDIVLPLTDPELIPLSTLKNNNVDIHVSDTESLKKITDKNILYKTLPEISPKILYSSTKEDVMNFINYSSDGETCFVKLKTAYGSRGTKKIVSTQKWINSFSTFKPEQFGLIFPIDKIELLLESVSELILLETLPGEEYSIDCIFDNECELKFYGVRQRELTRNGICHTAKFVLDNNREFYDFIKKITNSFSFKYNINIQAKRDINGVLKLLEINPRISGSLNSFTTIGYDFVRMCLGLTKFPNMITPDKYPYLYAHRISYFKGIT